MKIKKDKGFSLIEVMIVSVLMITVLGIVTNSLSVFMKYSSKNAIEDQAQYDINNIIKIIENDIHAANKTLAKTSDNVYTAGANTLILSEPVLNEYTVPVVDMSGNQMFDTIVITVVTDSTNTKKYLKRIVIPAASSPRPASNRVIYKSINPSVTNMFNYYSTSSTITTDYNQVTMIKFAVDAKIEYNPPINIKRYIESKLLNFGI